MRGPDKQEWEKYVGEYWVDVWGKPARKVTLRRNNGYLYFNQTRLIEEFQPALFLATDGEVVDFRNDVPNWRSIRLRRA